MHSLFFSRERRTVAKHPLFARCVARPIHNACMHYTNKHTHTHTHTAAVKSLRTCMRHELATTTERTKQLPEHDASPTAAEGSHKPATDVSHTTGSPAASSRHEAGPPTPRQLHGGRVSPRASTALTASSRHAKQQAFPFHQDSPARRYDPAAMMCRRWRCVPHPSASVHVCVGRVPCRCQTVLKRETVIRW